MNQKNNTEKFHGPLFIVGMPRSGTKLLRDLLNNHSQLGFPPNESHIIPYFYRRFKKYKKIHKRKNFHRFYKDFSATIFFQRLATKGPVPSPEKWYSTVSKWDYPGVLEAFYQIYAAQSGKTIWGDKTPNYLLYMPLLKSLFPEAKFIHIMRDVRDYCISINYAWQKNYYRAAQRWYNYIEKCRVDSKLLPNNAYMEITYEALIDNPKQILMQISDFAGVKFENEMLQLKKSTENLGNAQGYIGILKKNYRKWETQMNINEIRKIESICAPLLQKLGYPVAYKGKHKCVPRLQMFCYKIIDAIYIFRFEVHHNSPISGIINFIKMMKHP